VAVKGRGPRARRCRTTSNKRCFKSEPTRGGVEDSKKKKRNPAQAADLKSGKGWSGLEKGGGKRNAQRKTEGKRQIGVLVGEG